MEFEFIYILKAHCEIPIVTTIFQDVTSFADIVTTRFQDVTSSTDVVTEDSRTSQQQQQTRAESGYQAAKREDGEQAFSGGQSGTWKT